ncbi:hypothetical protein J437_LFUL010811 [Ladona fulva]|uniref:Uncharacterized protein n=1 Tax=Ladona fulva TaxID=123851 RepID=A0A8K0P3J2_LADFU|nr:hypothetical protein J437_LFUL010811 [Ladona fulva]
MAMVGKFDQGRSTTCEFRRNNQDGAEPSANSVSVSNLLRLSALLERPELREKAAAVLTAFAERLVKVPMVVPRMVSALMLYHDAPTMVIVTGSSEDPEGADALLKAAETHLVSGKILALADDPRDDPDGGLLRRRNEAVKRMKPLHGKAAAYVCRHHTCSLPVTSTEALVALLGPPEPRSEAMAASVNGARPRRT